MPMDENLTLQRPTHTTITTIKSAGRVRAPSVAKNAVVAENAVEKAAQKRAPKRERAQEKRQRHRPAAHYDEQ